MDYIDYLLQHKNKDCHFWYKARKKLIYNLLFLIYKNYSQNRLILDVGCGVGAEFEELKKFGRVTALDINKNALKIAEQQKVRTILADIGKCVLENEHYDAICCFDILEHLRDDQQVLNNIFQSLKTGGFFIFTVPAYQSLFGPHDLALKHQRRYNKKGIIMKLNKAGFKIVRINYWNSLLFLAEALFRLIKILIHKLSKTKTCSSDAKPLNEYVNNLLFHILNFENKLMLKRISLPFGLTIYGIVNKIKH